jgi:tRNA nucleotidyltransferase/poly(A) polymerase
MLRQAVPNDSAFIVQKRARLAKYIAALNKIPPKVFAKASQQVTAAMRLNSLSTFEKVSPSQGELLILHNNIKQSINYYLDHSKTTVVQRLKSMLNQAEESIQKNNIKQALVCYQIAIQLLLGQKNLLRLLIDFYLMAGKLYDSLKEWSIASHAYDITEKLVDYSDAIAANAPYAAVIKTIQEPIPSIVRASPSSIPIQLEQITKLFVSFDYLEQLKHFTAEESQHMRVVDQHTHLSYYSLAIGEFPNSVAYAMRANCYKHVKEHQKAIEDYTKAIEIRGEDEAQELYFLRAMQYGFIHDSSSAMQDLIRVFLNLGDGHPSIDAQELVRLFTHCEMHVNDIKDKEKINYQTYLDRANQYYDSSDFKNAVINYSICSWLMQADPDSKNLTASINEIAAKIYQANLKMGKLALCMKQKDGYFAALQNRNTLRMLRQTVVSLQQLDDYEARKTIRYAKLNTAHMVYKEALLQKNNSVYSARLMLYAGSLVTEDINLADTLHSCSEMENPVESLHADELANLLSTAMNFASKITDLLNPPKRIYPDKEAAEKSAAKKKARVAASVTASMTHKSAELLDALAKQHKKELEEQQKLKAARKQSEEIKKKETEEALATMKAEALLNKQSQEQIKTKNKIEKRQRKKQSRRERVTSANQQAEAVEPAITDDVSSAEEDENVKEEVKDNKSIEKIYPVASISLRPFEKDILKLLNDAGHKSFLVGGLVGDRYLDKTTGNASSSSKKQDVDIVTPASEKEARRALSSTGAVIQKIVDEFGVTLKVVFPNGEKIDLRLSQYLPNLYADAKSRDFTFNTLYADQAGNVYDPLGVGLKHLLRNELRLVDKQFSDDPSLIFRSVDFTTRKNKKIFEKTQEEIKSATGKINDMDPSYANFLMKKLFSSEFKIPHFKNMLDYNVIGAMFPEQFPAIKAQSAWIEKMLADQQDVSLNYLYALFFVVSGMSEPRAVFDPWAFCSEVDMKKNPFFHQNFVGKNDLVNRHFFLAVQKILQAWAQDNLHKENDEDKQYKEFLTRVNLHPAIINIKKSRASETQSALFSSASSAVSNASIPMPSAAAALPQAEGNEWGTRSAFAQPTIFA